MNRPLAEYKDGSLWIDDGGVYRVTTPDRLAMKLLVMRSHTTDYAENCVNDINRALEQYRAAQGETA